MVNGSLAHDGDRELHHERTRSAGRVIAVIAAFAIIGWIDYATGVEIRVFALYYAPIAYAAWHFRRSGAISAALLATVVWIVSNALGGRTYSHFVVWIVNAIVQGVSFTLVGVLIANLRERESRERNLGGIDMLTSLFNRRALYETGDRILERCRRVNRPVTVAYIDLDDFKLVNDRAGHLAGDSLLREVAGLIKLAIRPSDLVARFGGDEFVVLLPELAAHDAQIVLERVRITLQDAFAAQQQPITATIGAAAFKSLPGLDVMIRSADNAMYAAKRAGRNRIHIETVHAPLT